MVRNYFILLGMILCVILPMGCSEADRETKSFPSSPSPGMRSSSMDTEPPRVIATFPLNGDQDVDPKITEISVTFDEEMDNTSWSWAYRDSSKIPEMPGDPYYTDQNRKNILPVQLEPNKQYVLWINTAKFNYFKDKSGNSVVPYEFKFRTRASGE